WAFNKIFVFSVFKLELVLANTISVFIVKNIKIIIYDNIFNFILFFKLDFFSFFTGNPPLFFKFNTLLTYI
ncbi:hypothetical protein DZC34_15865, partial [Clostridium botulinum]